MKMVTSLALTLATCGVAWAQSGSSGSVGVIFGVNITYESKFEPSEPYLPGFSSGVKWLTNGNKQQGMIRYSTNQRTHEYFGYGVKLEPVDEHAGIFKVTFSALTLTPEDLTLPEPGAWRLLPAPAFPAPQIVSLSDTIAFDLFENPTTGQKIVDYIRLKRDNCDSESAGPSQITCLNSLVQDARRFLDGKLAQMEANRDATAVASLKSSQQSWEKYRDDACAGLATEAKRLQCELKLTRSRTHDLALLY